MNTKDNNELEDIAAEIAKLQLQLHPDDILEVWVPESTSQNEMDWLAGRLRDVLNHNQGIVFSHIKVMRMEEKEEEG